MKKLISFFLSFSFLYSAPLCAQEIANSANQKGEIPLVAVSGAARYRLSASNELFLQYFDAQSKSAFAHLSGAANENTWQALMTGAMQLRHENGNIAQTLWFNPIFDAGLLVNWQKSGANWVAVSSKPILGAGFRGADENFTMPMGEILAKDYPRQLDSKSIQTLSNAQNANWATLGQDNDADKIIRARIDDSQSSFSFLQLSKGYNGALALVRRMLVLDDPAAHNLDENLQAALNAYGVNARETLRFVSAYRGTDGWNIVMQSPDNPGLAWVAHFIDPIDGQPAKPSHFSLIDYSKPEGQN